MYIHICSDTEIEKTNTYFYTPHEWKSLGISNEKQRVVRIYIHTLPFKVNTYIYSRFL